MNAEKPRAVVLLSGGMDSVRHRGIVQRGIALGAPLHLTWSCYQNEEKACGGCASCQLRLRAFVEAGHKDPIPYQMR